MSSKFYKKNKRDVVFWVDNHGKIGEHLFSFDKSRVFNLFTDYPYKLTPEQKLTFDKENPYWKDFFSERK